MNRKQQRRCYKVGDGSTWAPIKTSCCLVLLPPLGKRCPKCGAKVIC